MYRNPNEAMAAAQGSTPVIHLDVNTRATFITRTYTHLLLAILAFAGIEFALFSTGLADRFVASIGRGWIVFFLLFVGGGWAATHYAHKSTSRATQYAWLGIYIALNAVIFMPILWVANTFYPGMIMSAASATVIGFTALTAIAVFTRKDFSFLRGILMWGSLAIFALILVSFFTSFTLGPIFGVLLVAFAGAAILYDTSNILLHYPEDRYVGASLSLFGSVAMMFYYILYLMMSLQRD
jgi:FtsH-binding integral membrane protein